MRMCVYVRVCVYVCMNEFGHFLVWYHYAEMHKRSFILYALYIVYTSCIHVYIHAYTSLNDIRYASCMCVCVCVCV